MRYRLMASYQGSPFEAGIGPTDGDIVLFAACPPPEELGFEPATGHWRKQLRIQDVQAVWESRPVGTFRGERCMVLDDLGDRLHIGYLGHDAYKAEQLGYWQVDRGVFELVAPRTEVSEILEERSEYPRVATAAPVSGGYPTGPGYPNSRSQPIQPGQSGSQPIQPGQSGSQPIQPGQSGSQPIPPAGHSGPLPTVSSQSAGHDELAPPVELGTGPVQPYRPAEFSLPAEPARSALSGEHGIPAGYLPHDPLPGASAYAPAASPEPYPARPPTAPGAYGNVPSYPAADLPLTPGSLDPGGISQVLDHTTGVAVPVTAEAPLPLEAEAMRAASARRPRQSAAQRRNGVAPADRPAVATHAPVPAAPPSGMPASGPASASASAPAMPASAPVTHAPAPAVPGPAVPGPAVPAPAGVMPASAPVTLGPARVMPAVPDFSAPASPSVAIPAGPVQEPDFAARPDLPGRPDLSGRPDLPGSPDLPGRPGVPGQPDVLGPADPAGQQGFSDAPGRVQAAAEPAGLGPGTEQHAAPLYVVPDPLPGPAEPRLAQPDLAGPGAERSGPARSTAPTRQRRAARRRMATERLFADLASQAGIPADTYAVGEEVEGAMCLIQTDGAFEVFHSADGARHELQVFATEESACFYLFGVLAAEAVRTGSLVRLPAART